MFGYDEGFVYDDDDDGMMVAYWMIKCKLYASSITKTDHKNM